MEAQQIQELFQQRFGQADLWIQSPGRINLIGEHTDYNEGYVLPAAIDKSTYFGFRKNNSSKVQLLAANLDQSFQFDLKDIRKGDDLWANYLMGIADELLKIGVHLSGVDCVFGGNLPLGSGMSSSAALETGFAYGLNALFQGQLNRVELAQLCQRSSRQFVGIPCGIMDQFAALMGRANHAIRLDCRSLEYDYIPLELNDYQLVLLNTNVHHTLANSAYADRVRECAEGVSLLQSYYPDINSLRDATPAILEEHRDAFDPKGWNRCYYVVQENERLIKACDHLQLGQIEALGQLMSQTHAGLSHLYEVSCAELDFLVEEALQKAGVAGARLMGGGFGGCTINLIRRDRVDQVIADLLEAYQQRFDREATPYFVKIGDGTRPL
ncbi:MAG TPA: galactokinase [Saprospiraceae bacterium]|nr:galactokinase [Saprospiraceae bacterium]HMQ85741.1 galactokinase [Saprospiraceae bacterium]